MQVIIAVKVINYCQTVKNKAISQMYGESGESLDRLGIYFTLESWCKHFIF